MRTLNCPTCQQRLLGYPAERRGLFCVYSLQSNYSVWDSRSEFSLPKAKCRFQSRQMKAGTHIGRKGRDPAQMPGSPTQGAAKVESAQGLDILVAEVGLYTTSLACRGGPEQRNCCLPSPTSGQAWQPGSRRACPGPVWRCCRSEPGSACNLTGHLEPRPLRNDSEVDLTVAKGTRSQACVALIAVYATELGRPILSSAGLARVVQPGCILSPEGGCSSAV